MKISPPVVAFIVLLVVHTLVSIAAYRFLTTRTSTPLPYDSTPIETTTPAQRARDESSFQIATGNELVAVMVPWSVRLYVAFGFAALGAALLIAIVAKLRASLP